MASDVPSSRIDQPAPRGRVPAPALIVGLVGLALAVAWAYAGTLAELAHRWSNEADYSHGFLVPLVALAILWVRRHALSAASIQGNWWGLAVLALSLAMRLVAEYGFYPLLHAYSLLPALAGICLLVGGRTLFHWAWPAIAFLVFMIPLPGFVKAGLSLPLQRTATVLSSYLLQALGQPAAARGNILQIEDFQLEVVAACSGLRLLMTITALVTAYAMLAPRPWKEKLLLVVGAIPIAVLANALRLTATGLLGRYLSGEAAKRAAHDGAGWLMIPLTVGLVYLFSRLVRRISLPPTTRSRSLALVLYGTRGPSWNVRLFAKSLLVAGLAVGGLIAVHHLQFRRMAGAYRTAAAELAREEQFAEAARQLQWYLQLSPDDAPAHAELAWHFDKSRKNKNDAASGGELRRAIELYGRAVDSNPADAGLRHRHVELLLESGRVAEAVQVAERLLAVHPGDGVGLRLLARARFARMTRSQQTDWRELFGSYGAALAKFPDHSLLTAEAAAISFVYPGADHPEATPARDEADRWAVEPAELKTALRQVCRATEHVALDPAARFAIAQTWTRLGEWQSAKEQFQKIVAVLPEDVRGHMGLAACHVQLGEEKQARGVLRTLFRDVPMSERKRPWMIAQSLKLIGRNEAAREYFVQALAADPENQLLARQAAELFTDLDPVAAESLLRRGLKAAPDAASLRISLALLLARKRTPAAWQEAVALVSDGQEGSPPKPLLARLYLTLGTPAALRRAAVVLEELIATSDARPADHLALARAYENLAQLTDAEAVYQRLIRSGWATPAHALAYLDFVSRHPGELPIGGDLLRRMSEDFAGRPEILFRVANLHFRRDETEAASRLYRMVISADPRHVGALNNLALLLSQRPQGRREALALIERALAAARPDNAHPALDDTKALILLRMGEIERGIEVLEGVAVRAKVEPSHRIHLALAYYLAGREQEARTALAHIENARAATAWLTRQEWETLAQVKQLRTAR